MAAPIYKGGRPFIKPGIRFGNDLGIFQTTSAPVDGTSGTLVGVAGPGAILQRTNGSVYVNTNTKASPTWVSLGVGAANAALTTPTLTAPAGTGFMITKSARFVEDGRAGTYTATIAIPAGSFIHDIMVVAEVLWNGTSATGKIGDTADDDGYFTGVNLKATDLLVGEVLSIKESGLWGGKEGAYLVAASGRRGPTASNFGLYYAAGSNITMIVTPGAADGSAGRTDFVVCYSTGEVISVV